MRALVDYHEDELHELQDRTGYYATWESFADNFKARDAMGTEYPETITETDRDMAIQISDEVFSMRYFDNPDKEELKTYLKASSGAFITDLISYIKGQDKFVIASAHDSSVTPLASILIKDDEWEATQVDYASFIAVEVLQDDAGNAYTKIRFRNGGEGFGEYMG